MPGIVLQRVGGLSPVRQRDNNRAPAKYGVWAFIFPYAEMFFLGGTSAEGPLKENDFEKNKSRYHQLKREGFRKFIHYGNLYTKLPVPKIARTDGWCFVDADVLAAYVPKYIAQCTADLRKTERYYSKDKTSFKPLTPIGSNPFSVYVKDDWEVFVPRPNEGRFKPKSRK